MSFADLRSSGQLTIHGVNPADKELSLHQFQENIRKRDKRSASRGRQSSGSPIRETNEVRNLERTVNELE